MEYSDFIKNKIQTHEDSGFDVDEKNLNQKLFEFQKFIVRKALRAGRYAVFADIGRQDGHPINVG